MRRKKRSKLLFSIIMSEAKKQIPKGLQEAYNNYTNAEKDFIPYFTSMKNIALWLSEKAHR